jgi:isoquinoline 1-oxidoreductase/isoquinoline 1-oxidoreductase beta subunit
VHGDFQQPIQITGGSTSVATRWDVLRTTGAQAREMLLAAAAARWNLPVAQLEARDGRVLRRDTGEGLTYGALASDAAKLPVPEAPRLKAASEYRYIGQSLRRFDAESKSDGSAVFGVDVDLPGLVNAVVLRNPHFGGGIPAFDATAAKASAGVIDVFAISTGIAVVADTYWHARTAAGKVVVDWPKGPLAGVSSETIRAAWVEAAKGDGRAVRDDGDAEAALAAAATRITAEYEVPYLAHATMEPQNSTAHWADGRMTVWSPNQGPDVTQALVADALQLPRDAVTVHTTLMGGGFGRRGIPDFAAEAAQVARRVPHPVKLTWSREDDMRHDFYRPATYNVLQAGLDANGRVDAWSHRIVAPSMVAALLPTFLALAPAWVPDWLGNLVSGAAGSLMKTRDPTSHEGAADHPYRIANVNVQHVFHDPGVPLGFWRSVGHSQNAFVTESFVDELAHAAKQDPYQFRRALLEGNARHLGVLDLAAQKANWGKAPAGVHQGIAVHESFGSVVAEVVEVRVVDGVAKLERIVCAVNCGLAVNPDQVKAQVESAVVFGLTAALKGRISIRDGAVVESNFHDYALLRMDETPTIEVHILPSDEKPTGIGEPGTPPIAPALANALFAATGKRQRALPLALA